MKEGSDDGIILVLTYATSLLDKFKPYHVFGDIAGKLSYVLGLPVWLLNRA